MDCAIVVVGAGQAACQFVASIRQAGYAGRLVLVGDETVPPYQRPPLSKTFLSGSASAESLQLRPISFYETARCETRLGQRVARIDKEARVAILAGGERIAYDALVLATGARARALPGLPESDRIHYLRDTLQAQALKNTLRTGKRLAVIGAGYVGMEVAASARKLGLEVTVLEAAPRVMQRSVGEAISEAVRDIHISEGVAIRLGCAIESVEAKAQALRITFDATVLEVDALVVGIGAQANTELASDCGLTCARGIIVDAQTRTSDPAIFAIGDCTEQTHALYGPGLRLESVANATEQAKIAAAVLAGRPLPAPAVPWFWSDQYTHRLQVAGLPHGHDEIVVRRPTAHEAGASAQSVWYLREGRVLAVEALDAAGDFMAGRNSIRSGVALGAARIADISQSLQPSAADAPANQLRSVARSS